MWLLPRKSNEPRRVAREVGWNPSRAGNPRTTLGTVGEDLEKRRPRWPLVALVAASVAAVVGFRAYVISASAGLNEPPPLPRSTVAILERTPER
jgi:hypothetical protein